MVMVELGRGNVLHHEKREGNCPGGGNVRIPERYRERRRLLYRLNEVCSCAIRNTMTDGYNRFTVVLVSPLSPHTAHELEVF